jgi:hypothetical protein
VLLNDAEGGGRMTITTLILILLLTFGLAFILDRAIGGGRHRKSISWLESHVLLRQRIVVPLRLKIWRGK